jgi:hypothetical protein
MIKPKFIALGSINIENTDLPDMDIISDFAKSDLYSYYNYIVDRKGDIHELIPIDCTTMHCQQGINIAPFNDKGYMTSECQKSLYNLIIYIFCKLTHEFNIILNSDSIITENEIKNTKYNAYKVNKSQFLALKRNITHGINECRYTKDYKNMFNFL